MTETFLRMKPVLLAFAILVGIAAECSRAQADDHRTGGLETIVVAGGCFWCVEADFEKVRGVKEVVSGFSGGTVPNPSYKQVTRGGTGHYEVVEITYDPGQIKPRQILTMFVRSIDPTDAGGQFCDRGSPYRTAIFVSNSEERRIAESVLAKARQDLGQRIVTPVLDFEAFYPAEDYHQDYYKKSDIVLTRFGPRSKAEAYKRYRAACKRDDRVRELWGDAAPFVGKG